MTSETTGTQPTTAGTAPAKSTRQNRRRDRLRYRCRKRPVCGARRTVLNCGRARVPNPRARAGFSWHGPRLAAAAPRTNAVLNLHPSRSLIGSAARGSTPSAEAPVGELQLAPAHAGDPPGRFHEAGERARGGACSGPDGRFGDERRPARCERRRRGVERGGARSGAWLAPRLSAPCVPLNPRRAPRAVCRGLRHGQRRRCEQGRMAKGHEDDEPQVP